jgi:hypothetical protein
MLFPPLMHEHAEKKEKGYVEGDGYRVKEVRICTNTTITIHSNSGKWCAKVILIQIACFLWSNASSTHAPGSPARYTIVKEIAPIRNNR